jgi:hypothetical protein
LITITIAPAFPLSVAIAPASGQAGGSATLTPPATVIINVS